jgi:hypothetical protein
LQQKTDSILVLKKGNYTIQLTDLAGRKVFSALAQHAGGNSAQNIILPAAVRIGMYQLLIIAADKTITTKKVLVENN